MKVFLKILCLVLWTNMSGNYLAGASDREVNESNLDDSNPGENQAMMAPVGLLGNNLKNVSKASNPVDLFNSKLCKVDFLTACGRPLYNDGLIVYSQDSKHLVTTYYGSHNVPKIIWTHYKGSKYGAKLVGIDAHYKLGLYFFDTDSTTIPPLETLQEEPSIINEVNDKFKLDIAGEHYLQSDHNLDMHTYSVPVLMLSLNRFNNNYMETDTGTIKNPLAVIGDRVYIKTNIQHSISTYGGILCNSYYILGMLLPYFKDPNSSFFIPAAVINMLLYKYLHSTQHDMSKSINYHTGLFVGEVTADSFEKYNLDKGKVKEGDLIVTHNITGNNLLGVGTVVDNPIFKRTLPVFNFFNNYLTIMPLVVADSKVIIKKFCFDEHISQINFLKDYKIADINPFLQAQYNLETCNGILVLERINYKYNMFNLLCKGDIIININGNNINSIKDLNNIKNTDSMQVVALRGGSPVVLKTSQSSASLSNNLLNGINFDFRTKNMAGNLLMKMEELACDRNLESIMGGLFSNLLKRKETNHNPILNLMSSKEGVIPPLLLSALWDGLCDEPCVDNSMESKMGLAESCECDTQMDSLDRNKKIMEVGNILNNL